MDDKPVQNEANKSGKPRISMYEFANRSGGLECRGCGCKDFRVVTTRRGENVIVRYRVCRHCGAKRHTLET